ncbi:hypothetical protein Tco_1123668 [Tanacetum coccineum]|uniref:Reverse transcriptase domain-containing protein n=1 Tax=Tanacetum coccineum TaxID=301880 RepID=A0ABQ5J3Z7_9ASTR
MLLLYNKVSELKNMMKDYAYRKKQKAQAPAPVKAVEQSCVTCGGSHSYEICQPPDGNIIKTKFKSTFHELDSSNFNQGNTNSRSPMSPPVYTSQPDQAPTQQVQVFHRDRFENYGQGYGTLLSNTVTNPKEDLKGITTRSGVAYKGPTIPTTSSPNVQPPVVPVVHHESISEPVNAPVSASMPNQKTSIPFPSRRNDERRREKANDQLRKFTQLETSGTFNFLKKPVGIAEDVFVTVGKFQFPADFVVVDFEPDPRVPLILGRSVLKGPVIVIEDVYESGNPTPYYDPIISTSSPTLTPFGDSDFLLFEEADSFLAIEDDPTSPEVDPILPVIIAKDLKNEEKAALIEVLKSHKRAIAWKLSDIKGIDPEFCTHKILMEEDYELTVQHQRRVNPKIHDVIKKEVEKLLDTGLIYPISMTAMGTKTPTVHNSYKALYKDNGMSLPIELEAQKPMALKHANFDIKTAGDQAKFQLYELYEML